jgi:hypothetical protein
MMSGPVPSMLLAWFAIKIKRASTMIKLIYVYYLYRHFKSTHFIQSSCILTETFRVSDQSCTGLFESTYTCD